MILHGDNLPILRDLCERDAKVHLAYLDPPFFTGRDFNYRPRGGGTEEHAYSDRWPSLDSYVEALVERAAAVRDLLTPDGSMVIHVDPTTSHYVRVAVDRVFGREAFANEIIWRYRRWPSGTKTFQWMHDILLRWVRDHTATPRWNQLYEPLAPSTVASWGDSRRQMAVRGANGKRVRSSLGPEPSRGAPMSDVWEIPVIAGVGRERTGYPTQKPEALLERLISGVTRTGDTVLDPYCGSGTTLAVAVRLGRYAIGIDSSAVATRVARERIANVTGPLFGQTP